MKDQNEKEPSPVQETTVTVESFDTDNMLRKLTSQQDTPFLPGQRINEDIAELLNGLPEALHAIRFYQQAMGNEGYTRFATKPIVDPEAAQGPSDADLHTVPEEAATRLIAAFTVNTKDGTKKPTIT